MFSSGVSTSSYAGNSEPYSPKKHGNRRSHRNGLLGSLKELESFDFSTATRTETKNLVQTVINTVTIMLFGYVTFGFAIFFGLFLCFLRKVENVSSHHYDCLQAVRPNNAP